MNCKPGDLAVVVGGVASLGKVLTCLRLATQAELEALWFQDDVPVWIVDRTLETLSGRRLSLAPDCMLRPIRPGDITDEEVCDLYAPKLPETVS